MVASHSPCHRLSEASRYSVEIVHRLANIEPQDTTIIGGNPWQNPQLIQEELVAARNAMEEAWEELKLESIEGDGDERPCAVRTEYPADEISEEEFRVLYMDMITDAFGDVLEQLTTQHNDNSPNVDVLVDCLQSGIQLLEPNQRNRQSFFDNLNDKRCDGDAMDEDGAIHECKQKLLGYFVSGGGDQ